MTLLQSLIFLAAQTSPFAIDHNDLIGVWVGVADKDPLRNHAYFEIAASNSGRFAFVAEGREILNFDFNSENVSEPEGYVEVSKSFDSWGAKVIVSGWVSGEDRGMGMLTGQLFMYKVEDDQAHLFNSFPLTMWAVSAPVPSEFASENDLRKIAAMYGTSLPDD